MTESLTEFLLVKISFVFLTLLKCNFCKAQSLPKSFSCFTSKPFHQQLCVLACRNCLYSKCSVSCQCGYWSSGNQRARTCYWYIITCLLSRCKNHLHSELQGLYCTANWIVLHRKLQALNWNVNHCNPIATWSPPFANDDEGVLQKLAITSDINGNGGFWIATRTHMSEI